MNEGTAEVIRVSVLLVAARRTGNSGRNMDTVTGRLDAACGQQGLQVVSEARTSVKNDQV